MDEDLYDIALEETKVELEEKEEKIEEEEEKNPANMQKYAVYVRKLIIGARKSINKLEMENEELKKNLENALNSSSVVTCPDCRHCFKERHHSIRPNHMKAFRANKCVELEFKSTEDMRDWLFLNQLETNSDGMPTVMKNENKEQDVSTLKSVGSKLQEFATQNDAKDAQMRKRKLEEEEEKKRIRIEITKKKKKVPDESAPSTSKSKSSEREKVEFGRSLTPELVMASSSRNMERNRREREHENRRKRRDRDEKSVERRKRSKDRNSSNENREKSTKKSILSRLSYVNQEEPKKSSAVRKIDVGEEKVLAPPVVKTSFKIPTRKNNELAKSSISNEKLPKTPAPTTTTTTKFTMLKEKKEKVENEQCCVSTSSSSRISTLSQNDNLPDSPNLISEFFPDFGRTVIVEPEIEKKEEKIEEDEEEDMSYWISGDAIESEGESEKEGDEEDQQYVYPESSEIAENIDVEPDDDDQSQFVIPITPKIQTNLEKIGEEEELDWDYDDGELVPSNYNEHISHDIVPITPNNGTTVASEEIEEGECLSEDGEIREEEEEQVEIRSISPIQKENRKYKEDEEELNRSRRGKRRNEWMAESYSNGLRRSFGGRRN